MEGRRWEVSTKPLGEITLQDTVLEERFLHNEKVQDVFLLLLLSFTLWESPFESKGLKMGPGRRLRVRGCTVMNRKCSMYGKGTIVTPGVIRKGLFV